MAALEIATGLNSLKTALDIAKALWTINDAAERGSKIVELQGAIASAQASAIEANNAHMAQIGRIHTLETEIADLKAWNTEKQRYELKTVGMGGVAFMLKPDARGTESPHWLCPNCFERRQKSYFQGDSTGRRGIYLCGVCKSHITANNAPRWL